MSANLALAEAPLLQSPEQSLPTRAQSWPRRDDEMWIHSDVDFNQASAAEVMAYAAGKPWVWPSETICFLCDIHADAEAFLLSLIGSGGVRQSGPDALDFELTDQGRAMTFVIGGDCLDKGPENLRLLRAVHRLYALGAKVKLLGGNHDLRTYLGIACAGRKEVRLQHLFVRMGKKTLTLLHEVYRQFVEPRGTADHVSDEQARAELFPSEEWYAAFRDEAKGLVHEKKLHKELVRIREKIVDLEMHSQALGLTVGALHAAVAECRRQFLEPGGEFAWFFERMDIAYRAGSFLFVHAGIDDTMAALVHERGVDALNQEYRRLLRDDLFELYHGPVGNCFRTKYRDFDHPLTAAGLGKLHGCGLYAIVHGHRNIHNGQRIVFRAGMLNFECDSSVDRNTRVLERLTGPGGAATLFLPEGQVHGISTDHPFIKVFDAVKICHITVI